SYSELKARSDGIARLVTHRAANVPVIIVLPQGIDAIAAQLGVLRAGALYVPADARDPPARVRELAEHVGARLVIGNRTTAASLREVLPDDVVVDIAAIPAHPATPLQAPRPQPDALAYVYYTSGSTGAPKGVADSHRNVLHNVLRYTRSLSITSS